jgi:hypothetical protein
MARAIAPRDGHGDIVMFALGVIAAVVAWLLLDGLATRRENARMAANQHRRELQDAPALPLSTEDRARRDAWAESLRQDPVFDWRRK